MRHLPRFTFDDKMVIPPRDHGIGIAVAFGRLSTHFQLAHGHAEQLRYARRHFLDQSLVRRCVHVAQLPQLAPWVKSVYLSKFRFRIVEQRLPPLCSAFADGQLCREVIVRSEYRSRVTNIGGGCPL